MAIPENYIDKITKDGDSRDICPSADKVRVNNANYEGTDLDSVLDEVATSEAGKVDKVTGKGLSTNDYTTAEKNKLAGLNNYDDTALAARVTDLEGRKRYFIELELDNQGNPMLEDQDGNFLTAAEFIALMQRPDLHEVQIYYERRVYYFDIRYDQGDSWRFWAVESARKRYMIVERDDSQFGLNFEVHNDMINASDIETGLEEQFMAQSEKDKLGGIAAGAQVNVKADWNASSGDAQILNKPTIPAAQVQSDWNATSGMGAILNKPTIPSKTSELTNDSGFITSQRTLINMGYSDGNLVFTDVDNNTLTHAQVISILHDTTKDVVITNNFSDTDNPEYVQLRLYQTIDEGNDCYTYRFCSIDVNTSRWFYFALFEDDGVLSLDEMYYDGLATTSSLATVATSGSYNDLTDKPNIPVAITVDSTITQNGTNPVQGGAIYSALEGKVPTTRKVNNKPLSTDITLTASDVGANVFLVTIEDDGNGGYTCDRTNAEIYAAWQAGRNIMLVDDSDYLIHLSKIPNQTDVRFAGLMYEDVGIVKVRIRTTNNQQTVSYETEWYMTQQ